MKDYQFNCWNCFQAWFWNLYSFYNLLKMGAVSLEKIGLKQDELIYIDDFIGDMNPLVWEGECSADPAYFHNFKQRFEQTFKKTCTAQEGFNFLPNVLETILPNEPYYTDPIRKICQNLTFEGWMNTILKRNPELAQEVL